MRNNENLVLKKAQLDAIYKAAITGIGGHFGVVFILSLFLSFKLPVETVLLGFFSHLSILLFRAFIVKKYNEVREKIFDGQEIIKWKRYYQFGVFLTGSAWGVAFMFFHGLDVQYNVLFYAIIVGLSGSGVMTLGYMPHVFVSYLFPLLGFSFFWLIFQQNDIYFLSALLSVFIGVYFFSASLSFSRKFKFMILEKEKLKKETIHLEQKSEVLEKDIELNKKLKNRLEFAIESNKDAVWEWSATTNSFYVSSRWYDISGYKDYDLSIRKSLLKKYIFDDDRKKVIKFFVDSFRKQKKYIDVSYRVKHKDGHEIWIRTRAKVKYDENFTVQQITGTHSDITQEKEIAIENAQQAQIIRQIHDSVISTDLNGVITSWNEGSTRLLEYEAKNIIGKNIFILFTHENANMLDNVMKELLKKGEYHDSMVLINKSKESVNVDMSLSLLRDLKDNPIGMIGYAQDISERIRAEEELLRQKDILAFSANHDALTLLPNRTLFNDRLTQGIEQSKRNSTTLALLFIDLDHFKSINDSLGHSVGDEVLKIAANRIKKIIRKEDTLARIGGDEFTVILQDISQSYDAMLLGQKIIKELENVILIDENRLYVSASIGVSFFPNDADNRDNLTKYADTAMYKAKDEGRGNVQFYSKYMTQKACDRVTLESNLREAIKNEEFVVYFQPQVDAKENKLIGMEALIRWVTAEGKIISPDNFIPLAEVTNLIVDIDRIMMKKAMKQFASWYKKGLNPGKLSMNLSVRHLEVKDFITNFKKLIESNKCKKEYLELEITESGVMKNPEKSIKILNEISNLGISLAIDDFGTGYSSLSYLKKFPINKLKIDKSFISKIPFDEEDMAISKAVIALASSLNISVIAEGVETKEQRKFLLENGCTMIQGYYYSKPIPSNEMEIILNRGFDI